MHQHTTLSLSRLALACGQSAAASERKRPTFKTSILRTLKSAALAALVALALAACDSSSPNATPNATTVTETPGVASITVTSVVDNQATVDWNLTSGTFAEHWRLYQNELRVCSGEPTTITASPSYQTGGCTITLQVGSNDVQVQLCNSDDSSSCSNSPTELIDYQEPTELGAIAWQDFPSSSTTSDDEHYLSWSKGEGVNADYWQIYQNEAIACSEHLSYSETLGVQSGGCDVTLDLGANTFQVQLCRTTPVGIADDCAQSPSASLTFTHDPKRVLARAVIEDIDESLPANYDLNISWSKDTSSGSAGEDWNLSNNGEVICQGVLTDGASSASCSAQLAEGSNQLQVRLCTDVETYSGSSCDYSAIVTVEGFDPNPLEPGTITITNSLPEQVSYEPSLSIDWQIADGNGVSSWSVSANGSIYCSTNSPDQYHQSGSCPIELENGTNSISVTGCNYGYDNSESCATSAAVSIEYSAPPGAPIITSPLPITSYVAEHSLSWERLEGEPADYWLALVNDTSQCGADLVSATPQSGSCTIELDSGANAISVRLCIANESGSAHCSNSELEQVELLAPVPSQPVISTPEQSVAEDIDSIVLEWSKSSGDNGSYWSLSNNNASVAACADQPLLSSGSSQSGSCDLPLATGTNLIVVHLCNTNAAGTASCSTSESVTITRGSAALEFTSASSASVAENTSAVFYTATISAADSSMEQISFSLSGLDSAHFNLDSASGELSFRQAPNYESPQDQNQDNTYELNISASDPLDTTSLEFSVSISDSNDEAPQVSSPEASTTHAISEITLDSLIYTVEASDADADDVLTYSLGGADASHFNLNHSSGELRFSTLPSLEQPQDSNGDNIYDLAISVSDTAANSTSFELVVTVVDDIGSAPEFDVTSAIVEFPENSDAIVYTAAARDPDGDPITYGLTGIDSAYFNLDPTNGELSFSQAPDFEIPLDHDQDNTYELEIIATDNSHSTSVDLNVSISNANEAHYFESTSSSLSLSENDTSSIALPIAADPDASNVITYELIAIAEGNNDYQQFNLSPGSSPSIVFADPLGADYENISDHNGDHTYEFILSAADAEFAASIDINLTITNLNDNPPTFTEPNPEPISIIENTSPTTTLYTAATDADGDAIAYSLAGADSTHFNLDSETAALSFKQSPDFDNPQDQDQDNTYAITVNATDADSTHSTSLDLSVEVSDVDEAPQFAQDSDAIEIPENTSTAAIIYTAAAIDEDGDTITYTLGGTDATHFTLNPATGTLNFANSPDFEVPQDQNGDNGYHIEIQATSTNHSASLQLSIRVTDVEEYAPYFDNAASVARLTEDPETEGQQTPILALEFAVYDIEDDAANRALSLKLEGADSSLFQLANGASANSHQVYFITSPDFDHPHDSDQDSNYSFTIVATDSDGAESQFSSTIVVEGIDDEAPYIDPAAYARGEIIYILENNNSAFLTLAGYDEDRSDWSAADPAMHYQPNLDQLSFALTATIVDSDSDLFYLNPDTLELSPKEPFDYETPQQKNYLDNLYHVEVAITDSAGNSNVDDPDAATRIVYVKVEDVENDSLYPQAKSGPQIPWFYSADGEMGVSERMKIPWYIYAGEGVVEWKMYVNGDVKCSYTVADLSAPVTSGTCALLGSEFVVGSLNNTATVSVVYADGSSASSETVTFGYAVAEIEGYYPEQALVPGGNSISSGIPSDCADVEIGEPVNHDSHSDCYNYLLYDDNFGGRFDDVPSYLWSGQYGLPFDVIAYFIEWGVYARDFAAHDLPANWLSTVLYSFIKFEGDNTTADDECEDCNFTGAVAIADTWAAFDKPFYMPGEEEKYADEAESAEELAEILLDKGVSTGKGIFQQFWLLKQKFPHLKTCLSVGGWSFSRPFPLVASDPDKRATFTKSIVDMAVEYHFDCIDIDWEFPGKAGGDRVAIHDGVATYDLDGDGISPFVDASEADAGYYVDLIAALRSEIDSRLDAEHIEINSAVYTSTEGMDLMDYGAFSGDLDGIHMMTYDYYGAWDPHTGLQAALYANTDPVSDDVATAYGDPYNPEHNIASAMARGVNNAIANGFGSELSSTAANIGIRQKIVPGLAFYGRNYSGVNIDEPVPGQYMVRATGTTGQSDGSAEQLGWEPGNLNYAQIDGVYFQGGTVKGNADYDAGGYSTAGRTWTYNWDDEAHAPFLYDADSGSFITYSDPRSIFFQTCHAAWHNSKGVMFWEISGDSANFELVQYIHFALHGYTIKSAEDTNVECDALAGIGEGETVYADDSGGTYMTYKGLEELAELGYINEYAFDVTLFPWRNGDPSVTDGSKTYTWDGFLKAAKNYPEFADQRHGYSTSIEARLREVAAFLANTAHTTAYPSSGSYALSNLGGELGSTRYDAGYYFQQEPACAVGGANYGQDICSYCDASHADYGEACDGLYADDSTKVDDFYYGRGPLQLQWNYHYGAFAEDYYSSADLLLYEPNKLITDSEAAFASALWRWMTPMDGKPSPHQVMTDQYEEQANFNRYPSFGMTINVLNGEEECGTAYDEDANRNRIGHFITILKSFNDTFREIEDPYRDIDPWTANYDFTITVNGSYPDSVLDFDEDEENIIERYSDVETYLSCKNMKNYQ